MKRPAFQFYGGDWLREPGLRACSLAARGLWIDMIALMSQVEDPYGHLVFSTKEGGEDSLKGGRKDTLRPILPHVLARMVGASEGQITELLDELESFGVFSRTAEGVIFSRRMVRDEKVRRSRAAGGFASDKNPNVPRKKSSTEDGQRMEGRIPLEGSFGGSPSSSSSTAEHKGEKRAVKGKEPAEQASPLTIARAVMSDLGIHGRDLPTALESLVRSHSRSSDYDPEKLRTRLVASWQNYKRAMPSLKYTMKPENFFGGSSWEDPRSWPWKDGASESAAASEAAYVDVDNVYDYDQTPRGVA